MSNHDAGAGCWRPYPPKTIFNIVNIVVSEDSKSPDFYLAKATGAFSVNKPPAPFSFQKPQPIIRWGTVPQTIGRLMIDFEDGKARLLFTVQKRLWPVMVNRDEVE